MPAQDPVHGKILPRLQFNDTKPGTPLFISLFKVAPADDVDAEGVDYDDGAVNGDDEGDSGSEHDSSGDDDAEIAGKPIDGSSDW